MGRRRWCTLFNGARNVLADRTGPRAFLVLPSQSILFASGADDALRVLVYLITRARLQGVLVLGFHVTVADLNGIQFVRSDTAIHEFLAAGSAVKEPFPVRPHQRYGEGPFFL